MDIAYIVTLNLMVVSVLAIVSTLMQMSWRNNVLWIAVNLAVLIVGLVSLNWSPQWSAILTAAIFVPFVLGPVAASSWSRASAMQNKPRRAALLGRIAAVLHPAQRTRFTAALLSAQAQPTRDARIDALRALARSVPPEQAFYAELFVLRAADDWRGVLALTAQMPGRDSAMEGLRIRALGETGQIDEMARAYEAAKSVLIGSDLSDATLFLTAFGGRPDATDAILEQSRWYDGDTRLYWSAIARRAEGESEAEWRQVFEMLALNGATETVRMRAAAKLREVPLVARDELTPAGARILNAAVARLERLNPTSERQGWLATPVTYALIAANIVVFAIEEWNGGSQDWQVLVDMGALWPPYVVGRGEWWRLIAATFLHYGPIHIIANGLMLFVLGPQCERLFGSLRFAIIYLVGGLASTGFVLGLYVSGFSEASVLVGASGAVMAIFGGLVAFRLVSWLRHRDVLDRRFLTMVPIVLAIQVAVDLSMPQVSLAAHSAGFLSGLAVGMVLAYLMKSRDEVSALGS